MIIDYPTMLAGIIDIPRIPPFVANSAIDEWLKHDPDGTIWHEKVTNNDHWANVMYGEYRVISVENQGSSQVAVQKTDRSYDPMIFYDDDMTYENYVPLAATFSKYLLGHALDMMITCFQSHKPYIVDKATIKHDGILVEFAHGTNGPDMEVFRWHNEKGWIVQSCADYSSEALIYVVPKKREAFGALKSEAEAHLGVRLERNSG